MPKDTDPDDGKVQLLWEPIPEEQPHQTPRPNTTRAGSVDIRFLGYWLVMYPAV